MSAGTGNGGEASARDWQPVRRVAPRIYTGELVSTLSALVLAALMFALDWYGAVEPPHAGRAGLTTSETAWGAMTLLRWVMLFTILVAVGATMLHASQRGHGARTDTSLPVTVTGTASAVLLGYRVLINPPHPSSVVDIKLGAYLGLLATVALALGGWQSLREERERRLRPSVAHREPRGRGQLEPAAWPQ